MDSVVNLVFIWILRSSWKVRGASPRPAGIAAALAFYNFGFCHLFIYLSCPLPPPWITPGFWIFKLEAANGPIGRATQIHTYTYARALYGLYVPRVLVPGCVWPRGLALPLFSFAHTHTCYLHGLYRGYAISICCNTFCLHPHPRSSGFWILESRSGWWKIHTHVCVRECAQCF